MYPGSTPQLDHHTDDTEQRWKSEEVAPDAVRKERDFAAERMCGGAGAQLALEPSSTDHPPPPAPRGEGDVPIVARGVERKVGQETDRQIQIHLAAQQAPQWAREEQRRGRPRRRP